MFTWDEIKRQQNISKHHTDFESVWDMSWERALHTPDGRKEYGEIRFIAMAPLNDRLYVCVYTKRPEGIRIISLRKANKREEKHYAQAMDH